ncbi:MAG: PHP domain-containing protein, partial [Acutalibacteraceae bacterium]
MLYYEVNDYEIYPSVVPAGKKSAVEIIPQARAGAFEEGKEYRLEIWGTETYARTLFDRPEVEASAVFKNGRLSFEWFFETEQCYVIKIKTEIKTRGPVKYAAVARLYALESDLYGLIPQKCDFHCHSQGSDGHEAQNQVMGNERSCGMDAFAITEHMNMESTLKAQKEFAEYSGVINLINGEEVHVPHDYVHAVNLGGRSLGDYYRENKEKSDSQIEEIKKSLDLPDGIDSYDFAVRLWISKKSEELGGLAVLTHPFWLWKDVFFQSPKTVEELIKRKVFRCTEILNGVSDYHTNSMQIAFYHEMRAKGYDFPIIGSSDSHTTQNDDYRDNIYCYTYVFARDNSWQSIKSAILDKKTVAVMKYPEDEHPTVTGDFRLVKYAEFLYYCYFEKYAR